jgi:hypothetical protein
MPDDVSEATVEVEADAAESKTSVLDDVTEATVEATNHLDWLRAAIASLDAQLAELEAHEAALVNVQQAHEQAATVPDPSLKAAIVDGAVKASFVVVDNTLVPRPVQRAQTLRPVTDASAARSQHARVARPRERRVRASAAASRDGPRRRSDDPDLADRRRR